MSDKEIHQQISEMVNGLVQIEKPIAQMIELLENMNAAISVALSNMNELDKTASRIHNELKSIKET